MTVIPNEKAVFKYTLYNDNTTFLIEACDISIDITSYSLKFRLGDSEESYENWSDWLALTSENLQKFGYISSNPIVLEVELHNTGLLDCVYFDARFRGQHGDKLNAEVDAKGTFLEGYGVGNAYTNLLSSNLLDKVKNGNYTAAFIQQDNDFDKVMSGITTFFASLFSYARQFKNITKSYRLLSRWLDNYGMYYSKSVTNLDDLNYLTENIYREFENRGTVYVTARKGELLEHSSSLVEGVKVDGEVLRILGIGTNNEFIFKPRKVDEMSWFVDKTSPNTYGWIIGKSTYQSPYGNQTNSGHFMTLSNAIYREAGELGKNYSRYDIVDYYSAITSRAIEGFKFDTSKNYCLSYEFDIVDANSSETTQLVLSTTFRNSVGEIVGSVNIQSFEEHEIFEGDYGGGYTYTIRGNAKGKATIYIVSPNDLNPLTINKTFPFTDYHVLSSNFSDAAVSPMTTIGKYYPNESIEYLNFFLSIVKAGNQKIEIKNITLSPLDGTENCFIEPTAQADLFFEKTQEFLENESEALEKIKEVLPYGVQFKMP